MIRAVIDGRADEFPSGASILTALEQLGIRVPTLCHDPRLTPTGACRSCLVSIKGLARSVPACATPLVEGMEIATTSPELDAHRRSLLTLLAWRYPAAAVARAPDKPFHRCILDAGLEGELQSFRGAAAPNGSPDYVEDRSHPYIAVDMSRCIHCYRCVRICDEVQGERVWHVRGRGLGSRIVPDRPSLRESSCVSCGACVDTCPTGALEDAQVVAPDTASTWTPTICPYCGTGCEMEVGTRDGRIVAVRPAVEAAVNKGHLCVKGRYAFGFVAAPDRVTAPMIRGADGWRRASWSEARALVVGRLHGLMDRFGPDSIGLLGSARATNEDNYLVQKLARVAIGTNNVDCCARVCHAPSAAALKVMLGAGLATNSFADIERARTILVWGANPTEDHPIVGARIRQAARRGARLIVVDPRRTELADEAACHLAITPGTDIPLLNAMANTIVSERLCDADFLKHRVEGVDEFMEYIAGWPASRAAEICHVDPDAIRCAARTFASGPPALTVHGLGLTEHLQGTDGVMALINLALLTGNIGRPGGGINPLRGQNNVQGAAHMGCEPLTLPGSMSLEEGRAAVEEHWRAPIPRAPGMTLPEMLDAARAGRLKALWAIGYDVFLTNPDAAETARALRALEFVIVQDLFLTETARAFGSLFLPACSSFEKEGTFMNAERRIQRVRAALRPAGESKPDWQIVSEVARTMGAAGFDYRHPEQIWNEIRALCSGARGMTYGRLDAGGLQWPCPAEDHPGTPMLHGESFAGRSRATLRSIEYHATSERTTPDYPWLLTTGRSLYQFNAGTMTRRTQNDELRPTDVIDISPDDAAVAGIRDGDRVRIVSRYGEAAAPASINAAIRPGQLFATFHTSEVFLNAVTGPNRDPVVGTPEYKVTAVRLERMTIG